MPVREYAVDGDLGFIGLNSRDNPVVLSKGFVTKSQNMRMDRGVATVRKGAEKLTSGALVSETIYAACTYTTSAGTELLVLACGDGLYTYNPDTEAISTKKTYPAGETITSSDDVDMYQAQGVGYVYICRGFSKSTLRWDGSSATVAGPGISAHHNYPNSRHAIYYGNRHIVQTDSNTFQVSHYLEDNNWSSLDMFSINDGGNDRLVCLTPWTLNEFVIFMRNSVFYASVGVGAASVGDPAQDSDSYIKSLATDIGCIARRSVVQAGGGIIFLSDNGVYVLNPSGASSGQGNTPEGMRLLTIGEPLSAPISDVIARINYNYVDKAVAVYWENRYYLAVPLDSATTNNTVLVYNFVNKAWESVDTYPNGFDINNFCIAKVGNRRRIFGIDPQQGIYLLENLEWDEYGASTGQPTLPFYLPSSSVLGTSSYTQHAISGELISRAYAFDTNREKRYSSVQADASFPAGSSVTVSFITVNPDYTTVLKTYNSPADEDFLLRFPVRKTGFYGQLKFQTNNLRPSIRSITTEAIIPGINTQTTK